jgi:hypothetical protein
VDAVIDPVVSILTYDGTVRMGARADEAIIDEPERLVASFQKELSALLEEKGAVSETRSSY